MPRNGPEDRCSPSAQCPEAGCCRVERQEVDNRPIEAADHRARRIACLDLLGISAVDDADRRHPGRGPVRVELKKIALSGDVRRGRCCGPDCLDRDAQAHELVDIFDAHRAGGSPILVEEGAVVPIGNGRVSDVGQRAKRGDAGLTADPGVAMFHSSFLDTE